MRGVRGVRGVRLVRVRRVRPAQRDVWHGGRREEQLLRARALLLLADGRRGAAAGRGAARGPSLAICARDHNIQQTCATDLRYRLSLIGIANETLDGD